MVIAPTSPKSLLPASRVLSAEEKGIQNSEQKREAWSIGDIFDEISMRVCQVIWTLEKTPIETTGCFVKHFLLNRVQVLTCFHDSAWTSASIKICYRTRVFEAHLFPNLLPTTAAQHDVCLIDIPDKELHDFPYFKIENVTLRLRHGDKVYFAGFPFGKTHPISNKGYISSTSEDQTEFTIDGTIVGGHSGGPVVSSIRGKLRLIGTISSQAVDMTKKLLEASQVKMPRFYASNNIPTQYGGSNVNAVLQEVIVNLLSNTSTGIGNARIITNVNVIFADIDSDIESSAEVRPRLHRPTREFDDYGAQDSMQGMLEANPMLFARSRVTGFPTLPPVANLVQASNGLSDSSKKVTELPVGRGERKPQAIRHRMDLYHEQKKKGKLNSIVGDFLGAKDKVEKTDAIAVGDHLDGIEKKKEKNREIRKEKDQLRREVRIQEKDQNNSITSDQAFTVLEEVKREIKAIQADESKLNKSVIESLRSKIAEVERKRLILSTDDSDEDVSEEDEASEEDPIVAFLERCKFLRGKLDELDQQRRKNSEA